MLERRANPARLFAPRAISGKQGRYAFASRLNAPAADFIFSPWPSGLRCRLKTFSRLSGVCLLHGRHAVTVSRFPISTEKFPFLSIAALVRAAVSWRTSQLRRLMQSRDGFTYHPSFTPP